MEHIYALWFYSHVRHFVEEEESKYVNILYVSSGLVRSCKSSLKVAAIRWSWGGSWSSRIRRRNTSINRVNVNVRSRLSDESWRHLVCWWAARLVRVLEKIKQNLLPESFFESQAVLSRFGDLVFFGLSVSIVHTEQCSSSLDPDFFS